MRSLPLAVLIMPGLVGLSPLALAHATHPDGGWRAASVRGSVVALAVDGAAAADDQEMALRVADSRSSIVPSLPGPALGENAQPQDFLRAARGSLAAGRTREAQQALEMAQTRMLDRSVAYDQTNRQSDDPRVARVSQALRALESGDRAASISAIDAALATYR